MKKFAFLVFLFSFVIGSIELNAQTSRLIIGSSIDLNNQHLALSPNSRLLFDIDFTIGFKTENRFIWGLRPEYLLRRIGALRLDPNTMREVRITEDVNVLGLGLFGRFFLPIGNKWRFLIDLNIAHHHSFAKKIVYYDHRGYFVGSYGGGFSYFLNEKLAIELLITLNSEEITIVEPFDFSDEEHSIRLGFQYFLTQ